jgi:hypothetical protein
VKEQFAEDPFDSSRLFHPHRFISFFFRHPM